MHINIYKSNFKNEYDLKEKIDDDFVNIKLNPNKTSNIIKLEDYKVYNYDFPNEIFYDIIKMNHACFFQSVVKLVLTMFRIETDLNIVYNNLIKNGKTVVEAKKLTQFINILTHANKNKFVLTQLYNFLIDYYGEKYIKYIGFLFMNIEHCILLNMILKVLNDIDSNVYKIC